MQPIPLPPGARPLTPTGPRQAGFPAPIQGPAGFPQGQAGYTPGPPGSSGGLAPSPYGSSGGGAPNALQWAAFAQGRGPRPSGMVPASMSGANWMQAAQRPQGPSAGPRTFPGAQVSLPATISPQMQQQLADWQNQQQGAAQPRPTPGPYQPAPQPPGAMNLANALYAQRRIPAQPNGTTGI